MLLHNHLSLANYTITTATNGVEALQIIEQSDKFDAVLLDVMMPKMNGFEACEKIRKLYPSNQLPIIILTAKGRVEDMKASFDAGANDVLSKPTSRTELLQRVRTHISVVRLNDDLNVANEQLKQHAKALEQQVLKRTTQLELRGAELEQRSIQLQERTTQLEGVNEQLHDVNEQLRDSAKGVLMLEELGRGLTSTLELNQVIKSIYQSSIKILDADAFMLGIWYSDKSCLNVPLIIEEGLKLPPVDYGLTDINSPAIWCVKNQKEVLIFEEEDVYNYFELGPAAPKRGKSMQTVVYLPLLLGKQTVGCLSVQNLKENAFSQEQLDRLRMLGSYSAIAIGNATGYAKLQEAHQALKETQKQLVLQEKMASFGTLTAGVAHELNNPTNFVHVGAANLKVDLSKLHTFIMELTEEDADKEIIDSFNIRFESLNQHIQTIVEGTVRIKTIVEDLRSFTHFQTADKKAADINYCVESTINLVKSDPKHKVEFFLDIKPLPKLTSYPARLNQVFLNIMINACDAIAERQVLAVEPFMGKIFVSSQFKNGNLVISISDNGCGMSEQTRVQMFEPFFTTKQVGEGTGLGMAISFGIVEEHGGTIIAKSTKGVGSVVTVLLPLL
jgi:signal transduction histidine kinase/DNA-binding response OmpR family regulator